MECWKCELYITCPFGFKTTSFGRPLNWFILVNRLEEGSLLSCGLIGRNRSSLVLSTSTTNIPSDTSLFDRRVNPFHDHFVFVARVHFLESIKSPFGIKCIEFDYFGTFLSRNWCFQVVHRFIRVRVSIFFLVQQLLSLCCCAWHACSPHV